MGAQSRATAASWTKQIETAAKALVLEIVANLIEATPVDTGWARANWIPSIGQPASSPSGDPTHVDTSAQQQGSATVLSFTIDLATMYVANFVPYIQILNYGSSSQAPALFIEFCVDQALQTIQQRFPSLGIENARAAYLQQVQGKIVASNVVRAFHALKRAA